MSIMSVVYTLIGVIILTYILTVLFNFLGVDFAFYGNYLLWLIALIIFFMVLPASKTSNLF